MVMGVAERSPEKLASESGYFDIDSQFTFYAAYHNHTSNQIIHIIFVWPILWTGYVLLCYIPPYVTTPWLVVDQALLAMISYVFFYMVLEVKNHKALSGMGALAAGVAYFCYATAKLIRAMDTVAMAPEMLGAGPVPVWKVAAVLHVACWVAQFLGHGVFEKRAPAVLDNLVQAIFMAPLFVIMEVFFYAGFKQEYRAQVQKKVDAAIASWRAAKAARKAAREKLQQAGADPCNSNNSTSSSNGLNSNGGVSTRSASAPRSKKIS